MRRVRGKDTTPEKAVRSLLHRLGFRFRLHRRDLPGKPDIVLPRHKAVVFVHGCFWHRHSGCVRASTPATRQDYWLPKFQRTVERDSRNQERLAQLGWNVIVVWECELRDVSRLADELTRQIRRLPLLYPTKTPKAVEAAEEPDTYGSDNRGWTRL